MPLKKLKDSALRLAYAEAAVEFGWSRNVLGMHIESKRLERQGRATTNFERSLPKSDQLMEALPDPLRTALPTIEQIERELGEARE